MGMNRYMLTIVVIVNLSTFISVLALDSKSVDLSIVNDSDNTLLITFNRYVGSESLAKLLEPGEAIDFGKVYEASVQSYSVLWGYIAPAKQVLFPSCLKQIEGCSPTLLVRIKGISGRSLFQPFGQWDYDVVFGKEAIDLIACKSSSDCAATVLDAFPTAKRKIMYTPRYVLGLPQHAGLQDAIEASLLLESKWQAYAASGSVDVHKITANIITLIDVSRKAFQCGQADIPLHIPVQMRCGKHFSFSEDDPAAMAWS